MSNNIWRSLLFFPLFLFANDTDSLFHDLEIVERVDKEIQDTLPFIYNHTLQGGYFVMPSARVNEVGMAAIGAAYVPPYDIFSVNFQMFSHIEFSGNYRIFNGITEANFGHKGFGDDADRVANIKIALLRRQDGFEYLPDFAIGFNDFYGSRRFHSFYVVATKEVLKYNFEATFGWGKDRIDGFFGGVAWTPFRQTTWPILKNLTLLAEYDAMDYKKHRDEHPDGRSVKWRVNVGLMAYFWDILQLKVSSLRGEKIAASLSLNANLGETKGFFAKVDNPPLYEAPINMESIGPLRSEKELAHEIAFAFAEQGIPLYRVYTTTNGEGKKGLYLKMVNVRYRQEKEIRERLESLLSALIPSNIFFVTVVVEANGIPVQEYYFRGEDLRRYHYGMLSPFEFKTLSPLQEASPPPSPYDSALIYKRKKDIWTFTIRPRLLSFFGSVSGKYKYSLGFVAGPEGYLFDQIYYKLQVGYSALSSMSDVGDMDMVNPSQLINVRSDTVRYYQENSFSLEQAYIQKGFNLGKGWFTRLASGYFEPAYAGAALEFLYYPVQSNWAIGISGASVLKRSYHGLGFTTHVRKLDGFKPEFVHFIGYQYFLDFYYMFKPLWLDFQVSIGQFLARDKGARFEIGRTFPSGFRFSIWYTLTNGNDRVNNERYYDKGIIFSIPLDFFLKKSSRTRLGYAVSAWLRDVGAQAATGKQLYPTLFYERL